MSWLGSTLKKAVLAARHHRNVEDSIHSAQLSDLQSRLNALGENLDVLRDDLVVVTEERENTIPGMINLADNTDFSFRDSDYINATYAGPPVPADVVARWYHKGHADATAPIETTPTVLSANNINTGGTSIKWNKTQGTIEFGGDRQILHPLRKLYAYPGAQVVVRMQVKRNAAVQDGSKLRVRLIEEGAFGFRAIEGQPFNLNSIAVGSTGVATREYILEVVTPAGSFLSNVNPTPVSTVATTNLNETNYVDISWVPVPWAIGYKLWRSASDVTGGFRLLYEIYSGATSFKDRGGVPSVRYAGTGARPIQANAFAQQHVENMLEEISTSLENFVFVFNIPLSYDISAATKHWILIDCLANTWAAASSTEVPDLALTIDKVGLSYTNGRWTPSAHDQEVIAASTATAPPPPPAPGGGQPPEGEYGGIEDRGCVVGHSLLMIIADDDSTFEIPIASCKVGMRVLSVSPVDGSLNASKIKKIIRRRTSRLFEFCTESGKKLICSPSHPLITGYGDTGGTPAYKLENAESGSLLCFQKEWKSGRVERISYCESWKEKTSVFTLELEEGDRTYITNGIVGHNIAFKPSLLI